MFSHHSPFPTDPDVGRRLPQKNRDPAFAEMLEAQQAKDSGKGKKAA